MLTTPNPDTWRRAAAILAMLPGSDAEILRTAVEAIGRAMLRAGHDPAFIAAEMQWLCDRYSEMRAAARHEGVVLH